MHRLFALFAIALSAIALSSIATASTVALATPTKLVPTGPWKIEYSDLNCDLQRPMSAAGDPYALSLSIEPLDSPIILTIKHAEPVNKRDDGNATVHANGTAQAATAHFNFYKSPDKLAVREYILHHGQHGLGTVRDRLRLETPKCGDFELQLPQFQSAMAALATCKVDLHRSLGIDTAVLKSMVTKPEAFSARHLDLPSFGDEGLNFILLYWVKEDGKVEQCRLLAPSGFKSFDEKICPTLEEKAVLTPAKDSAGRAIRVPVYENVRIRREVFNTSG